MTAAEAESSVGIVETRYADIPVPPEGFALEGGDRLRELRVAYEAYGTLSPARDNVCLICHALSGDAHAAGFHSADDPKPGWWDLMIGPGKPLDTDRLYVVCSNILGGCKGTTGPSSINPDTGRPYASGFPRITVGDMVEVQRALLRHLGIDRLKVVVGGSLGGMQVLEWAIRFPDAVERCVCIASAAALSTQALAFDIVGRNAIMADPDWAGGDYYGTGRAPAPGLAQARMIGHITYLSREIMAKKFGREKRQTDDEPARFTTLFQVESYLHHQGTKFVDRFDANSYLHITEAMDTYDLAERYGDLLAAFRPVRARFLVVALSSDWLFPKDQSIEIAAALLREGKRVSYCLLDAPNGHDAFLLDIPHLGELISTFVFARRRPAGGTALPGAPDRDFALLRALIPPGARILDLGCGDGELLDLLTAGDPAPSLGVDIEIDRAVRAIGRGLDVFQIDIDHGLDVIPDDAYDCVLLSRTLQVVHKPRLVLAEMLRVARRGIVTFPNFAHWTHRLRLGFSGRMPKSGSLPFDWYDTPNIHLATLSDFVALCRQDGVCIERLTCVPGGAVDRLLLALGLRNLGADEVMAMVARGAARTPGPAAPPAPEPDGGLCRE